MPDYKPPKKSRNTRWPKSKSSRHSSLRYVTSAQASSWLLIVVCWNQYAGTTSNAQTAVDKETDVKLQSITASYERNKQMVVKKLLDRVVLVKPELHRNLKKLGT